jgi:5-methylcytosine-specific restriction enzyme A
MTERVKSYRPPRFGKAFAPPEASRPSAAKRGYDRKWRAIRAQFLKAHPFCACGASAIEVDHIISLRRGGSNKWSNLQPMCKPCHSRKTVEIDGALNQKNRSGSSTVDPLNNETFISTKLMFDQGVSSNGKE